MAAAEVPVAAEVAMAKEVFKSPPVAALNKVLNPNGGGGGAGGGLRDLINPRDFGLGGKSAPNSFGGGP